MSKILVFEKVTQDTLKLAECMNGSKLFHGTSKLVSACYGDKELETEGFISLTANDDGWDEGALEFMYCEKEFYIKLENIQLCPFMCMKHDIPIVTTHPVTGNDVPCTFTGYDSVTGFMIIPNDQERYKGFWLLNGLKLDLNNLPDGVRVQENE